MKYLWGMRTGSTAGALIAMFILLGPGGATAASPGPDGVGSGSLNAATSAGTGNLSIGKTTLVARGAMRGEGKAYLLVPIVYPIDMSGRGTEVRVSFRDPNGQKVKRVWEGPLTAGLPRPADRRTGFRFIHEIRIGIRSARRMLTRSRGAGIRVRALARVDIEGDGRAELDRVASRIQRRVKAAGAGRCASSGLLRARSGASSPISASLAADTGSNGRSPRNRRSELPRYDRTGSGVSISGTRGGTAPTSSK